MSFKDLIHFFKKSQLIHVYTDGSHKGKWGSWAFVIVKNNKIIFENSGRVRKTNSHRMEFQAAIEALTYLKNGTTACLYSDSKILINSINDSKDRLAVNADQIEKIIKLTSTRNISWNWVKAHSGVIYNERCDELCVQART